MKVYAERVGNRIYTKSPFAAKDALKSIPGHRWSKTAGSWTFPLDLEVCRMLREAFKDDLEVGDELNAWAEAEKQREVALTSVTNVTDIDVMKVIDLPVIREVAPTMWAAMQNRPYQPVASFYMARARQCLNADEPGVGKTIETLGALVQNRVTGPVLVLAPKTSCQVVWEPEIERWLADDVPYTITQTAGLTAAQREEAWEFFSLQSSQPRRSGEPDAIHFLIANAEQAGIKKFTECPAGICDGDEDWCPEYGNHRNASETRRPFLHAVEWSAIIADETHKWLINTRGKAASQVGYGFTKLRTVEDGPKYALSGTPLKGKKYNIFGTLNWLRPKVYTSKWAWAGRYFNVVTEEKDIGRRGTITTTTINELLPERKEAFLRSLNTVMIRRTKDELRKINPAWMPPEKVYHDVWVPLEGKQKTHYKAMAKNAEVALSGGTLTATGVLAEMTRLRQFANSDGELINGEFRPMLPSAKFDWLLQFLEERGIEPKGELSEDVHKVVVASQFTTQVMAWAEALASKGIACYTLTGKSTDKERERVVHDFQNRDDVRVILINTMLGGVSITLDSADDMVVMDETWVPDDQIQVEDRVHRASNVKHQVEVWYIRTKGTIEEDIAGTNATKAESNHVVLDAQRGLKFAAERFGTQVKKERKVR